MALCRCDRSRSHLSRWLASSHLDRYEALPLVYLATSASIVPRHILTYISRSQTPAITGSRKVAGMFRSTPKWPIQASPYEDATAHTTRRRSRRQSASSSQRSRLVLPAKCSQRVPARLCSRTYCGQNSARVRYRVPSIALLFPPIIVL